MSAPDSVLHPTIGILCFLSHRNKQRKRGMSTEAVNGNGITNLQDGGTGKNDGRWNSFRVEINLNLAVKVSDSLIFGTLAVLEYFVKGVVTVCRQCFSCQQYQLTAAQVWLPLSNHKNNRGPIMVLILLILNVCSKEFHSLPSPSQMQHLTTRKVPDDQSTAHRRFANQFRFGR